MKLHLSNPSGLNGITGYGDRYVEINHRRHTTSLVITPQALYLEDWAGLGFEELNEDHFARLAQLKPEMVLLGTGAKLRFPHPRLSRALAEARIGLDVMDSRAACRTYNILMAEGRNVLALILQ
ncbi:MAG TPA: Mth938-like domain-containing protein [Thiobacillaceae bacterium]|nr:Mth938-like domain-containing protein [Thiobacillaceae bacterium]